MVYCVIIPDGICDVLALIPSSDDSFAVLEVYTGWCGPCISMLSALKKIKLEKGGEDLVLATVRSDDVQTFARLQNKSEPTWLLAVRGKLVTGMFGSNVPRLMQMIGDEIDAYRRLKEGGDPADEGRRTYELGEMVPCEQERYDARKAIEDVCVFFFICGILGLL